MPMEANAVPPTKTPKNSTGPFPLHESAPLALLLFVFWVILSCKIDFFHLAAGAVSSVAIAVATCRLYALSPPIGPAGRHPFWTFPWIRLLAYVPWLATQIVVSSFQVAQIVLSPKMKIRPDRRKIRLSFAPQYRAGNARKLHYAHPRDRDHRRARRRICRPRAHR